MTNDNPVLFKDFLDLHHLSARCLNALEREIISARRFLGIKRKERILIGDVAVMSEAQILSIIGLGRKSLNEIKAALAKLDLSLEMDIPNWPPENVDEIALRFEDHY